MHRIYGLLVWISWQFLKVLGLFNAKLKLFVAGRKHSFKILSSKLNQQDSTLWVHVASLGEYEQGLPLLEKIKDRYPNLKLVLTFFSPSGLEVVRGKTPAEVEAYLPMDTLKNASKFIELINPTLAIFVKYEVWPNYLQELDKNNIPTLMVSGIFRKRQIYFKPWGGFLRKALTKFSFLFVQDEESKTLLESIDIQNVQISGDTRFDRVFEILNRDNRLEFMERFTTNKKCFVAGSTWPDDESILVKFINENEANDVKWVIAPHDIKESHITTLENSIEKRVKRYSRLSKSSSEKFDVLIVDTIGLLTKIYSYATLAYVGGGFKTGLHNTLEPAVFGIPILIGPNYTDFKEASDMVEDKGIVVIRNYPEFAHELNQLLNNKSYLMEVGQRNYEYVKKRRGASNKVLVYLDQLLGTNSKNTTTDQL